GDAPADPAYGVLRDPGRPRAGGDPRQLRLQRRMVPQGARPLLSDGTGEAAAEGGLRPRPRVSSGSGRPPAVPHHDGPDAVREGCDSIPQADRPRPPDDPVDLEAHDLDAAGDVLPERRAA